MKPPLQQWRWPLLLPLLFLYLMVFDSHSHAHALLVRSIPAAGAELTSAPATVELWFSEPLENRFSNAHLVDALGTEIAVGNATVDTADPMHMTLALPPLAPGIYTVVWRTLSSADGHEWVGSFPITLLNADGTRPSLAGGPLGGLAAQGELPSPVETAVRWLSLMGALLLLGAAAFRLWVVDRIAAPAGDFPYAVARGRDLALLAGLVALLSGGWQQMVVQADKLGDAGMVGALLIQTRTGNLILARQTVASMMLVGGILLRHWQPQGKPLMIAFRNHRWVHNASATPADDRPRQRRYRTFLRQIGGESSVGVVLMVVVAMLVQTPPQIATAPSPPAEDLFTVIVAADDLTIHLQIAPNQVGNNRYITHLYHADGSAIGEVQLVRLQFNHQTAELGQATLDLAAQGQDTFSGEGAYLNRAGPWEIALYIRRRGMDDLLTTTAVTVPDPMVGLTSLAKAPWKNPIPLLPTSIVIGGVVLALLGLPFLWRYAHRMER